MRTLTFLHHSRGGPVPPKDFAYFSLPATGLGREGPNRGPCLTCAFLCGSPCPAGDGWSWGRGRACVGPPVSRHSMFVTRYRRVVTPFSSRVSCTRCMVRQHAWLRRRSSIEPRLAGPSGSFLYSALRRSGLRPAAGLVRAAVLRAGNLVMLSGFWHGEHLGVRIRTRNQFDSGAKGAIDATGTSRIIKIEQRKTDSDLSPSPFPARQSGRICMEGTGFLRFDRSELARSL